MKGWWVRRAYGAVDERVPAHASGQTGKLDFYTTLNTLYSLKSQEQCGNGPAE